MRGKCYCDKCKKTVEANCPACGQGLPIINITVDLIIVQAGKLWLVKRKAHGWALPGGYVEYDETLEEAAMREGREELGAREVALLSQFHTYGDPGRDPRRNVTVAYIAQVDKVAPDMAALREEGIEDVKAFPTAELPPLVFDHNEIVADYLAFKQRLLPLKVRRARCKAARPRTSSRPARP
jgi:ADP-ribose pyrophosphatase YjhB (NUDIX family)